MNNLINWDLVQEKSTSIYNQLTEKLVLLENKEHYENNLTSTSKISSFGSDIEDKYMKTIAKMDCLDNLTPKQKAYMMISYGVLVCTCPKINERREDEIFLISYSLSYLDVEDYKEYMPTFQNSEVVSAIINKTDDFREQVNIVYAIIDMLNNFDCPDLETLHILNKNALNIIENYNISHQK